MTEPVSHLGANIYCWSQTEQNLLLVECIEPAVRELREGVGSTRFWFDRFDARGPHIVILLTLPTGALAEAKDRLQARIDAFLVAHPPSGMVRMVEAEKRHVSCRGAYLSQLDRGSDLAPEGSFAFFEHSADGYPYLLTQGLPPKVECRVWGLIDELSLWTIHQFTANPAGAPLRTAVLWLAAFDQFLNRLHPHPEDYWRFHASTLLFGLPKKLAEDERQVLTSLPTAIGERNAKSFDALWREMESQGPCWPGLEELLKCALTGSETKADSSWRLPREIVHWTLKHLCLYVGSEIPLVLYAWHRSMK
jgi:hypothetical protein